MLKRLEHKSVIVTGASKGIGKGMAKVFVVSRHKAVAEQTVSEIQQAGGDALFFQADVTHWHKI